MYRVPRQPHLHHHRAYSFWRDSPRCDEVYHLQQSEAVKIHSMPEILTVLSQFNLGKEVGVTADAVRTRLMLSLRRCDVRRLL